LELFHTVVRTTAFSFYLTGLFLEITPDYAVSHIGIPGEDFLQAKMPIQSCHPAYCVKALKD